MEKRPWTPQEDRLLKYVFETSRLTKWSHIARRLQEEHGVKGRNGKQCKERYALLDPEYRKEEWSYDDEQNMIELHNQLGNKWAVIGSRLGGRSDNAVKNHFYALLRKALRKINAVIHQHFKKEYKQFSPTVLYRIVEVGEEKFKLFPGYDQMLCQNSHQLKNDLFQFSYDDEVEGQEQVDVDLVRQFIARINEFATAYKRRPKKERRASGQSQDLLTPTRYHLDREDKEQSQGNNSFLLSSDTSNVDDISDDQLSRGEDRSRRRRKSSAVSADLNFEVPQATRSRAKSQGNFNQRFTSDPNFTLQQKNEATNGAEVQGNISGSLGLQGIMTGMSLLMQQEHLPPDPSELNRAASIKYSAMVEEDYRYFQESGIQMRILPQIDIEDNSNELMF